MTVAQLMEVLLGQEPDAMVVIRWADELNAHSPLFEVLPEQVFAGDDENPGHGYVFDAEDLPEGIRSIVLIPA